MVPWVLSCGAFLLLLAPSPHLLSACLLCLCLSLLHLKTGCSYGGPIKNPVGGPFRDAVTSSRLAAGVHTEAVLHKSAGLYCPNPTSFLKTYYILLITFMCLSCCCRSVLSPLVTAKSRAAEPPRSQRGMKTSAGRRASGPSPSPPPRTSIP